MAKKSKVIKVHEAKPGQIIRMVDRRYGQDILTDRFYKVSKDSPIVGKVSAWPRFANYKVKIHPDNRCVVYTDQIDGF